MIDWLIGVRTLISNGRRTVYEHSAGGAAHPGLRPSAAPTHDCARRLHGWRVASPPFSQRSVMVALQAVVDRSNRILSTLWVRNTDSTCCTGAGVAGGRSSGVKVMARSGKSANGAGQLCAGRSARTCPQAPPTQHVKV